MERTLAPPASVAIAHFRALTHTRRLATWRACLHLGEVAEWLKAADCKSARASVRWFESSPLHQPSLKLRLASQLMRLSRRVSAIALATAERTTGQARAKHPFRCGLTRRKRVAPSNRMRPEPRYQIVQLSRIDVSCFGLGSSLLYWGRSARRYVREYGSGVPKSSRLRKRHGGESRQALPGPTRLPTARRPAPFFERDCGRAQNLAAHGRPAHPLRSPAPGRRAAHPGGAHRRSPARAISAVDTSIAAH